MHKFAFCGFQSRARSFVRILTSTNMIPTILLHQLPPAMASRRPQPPAHLNGAGTTEPVTQDDLSKYRALMLEANIEIDNEALTIVSNLLRLGVSPDEIYSVLKEISPVCGILKRFRLKTTKPSSFTEPQR